ncbi:MAG: radical SAM peptide maturase, partial [bacterium]|nr:radical SAM peptide maturase [bacterium]
MKTLRIKTTRGNDYLISRNIPQVLLLHPVLNYLSGLAEQNVDLEDHIEKMRGTEIAIEENITIAAEELVYYYRHYLLLRDNGYFTPVKNYPMTDTRFNAREIESELANTLQITFEVCDYCNLNCRYCAYGDMYTGYDKREKKKMDVGIAKKFLDYMMERFKSPLNRKLNKRVCISFYGGEPTLNMPFIKEIVAYVEKNKVLQKRFFYAMTTNGTLLNKNIDFFVKHNFRLLVSLDGNEAHNGYRVFHDDTPSFDTVYKNILEVKENYPEYYERNISFISVIHQKNSRTDAKAFIEKELGKSTLTAEVNELGIRPEKIEEFKSIYKDTSREINPAELKRETRDKEKILVTPFTSQLGDFFLNCSGFVFRKYDSLLYEREKASHTLTGTCNPFQLKVFITANGRILPCERIRHDYGLGYVDETGVQLDFGEVAYFYNAQYRKMMEKCNNCAQGGDCSMCIFRVDLRQKNPHCDSYMDPDAYAYNLKFLM